MQYTIRNITPEIDRAVREQVDREGLSLNEALVRALREGLGVEPEPRKKRDFSSIFKGEPLEPEVIQALEDQRQIDPELWD